MTNKGRHTITLVFQNLIKQTIFLFIIWRWPCLTSETPLLQPYFAYLRQDLLEQWRAKGFNIRIRARYLNSNKYNVFLRFSASLVKHPNYTFILMQLLGTYRCSRHDFCGLSCESELLQKTHVHMCYNVGVQCYLMT